MQTRHVFSHICEDAKGKETRSQTKEVVPNIYGYFKELNMCKQTQGYLNKQLIPQEFKYQHQEATDSSDDEYF